MEMGERARAARKRRGLELPDMVETLRELDIDVSVAQLSRIERGERPGDPRVWGGIWEALGLPLHDLYRGLGLPVSEAEPTGILAEIISSTRKMPPDAQQLVLGFARQAPQLLVSAQAKAPEHRRSAE